jgi:hypothetical protein
MFDTRLAARFLLASSSGLGDLSNVSHSVGGRSCCNTLAYLVSPLMAIVHCKDSY